MSQALAALPPLRQHCLEATRWRKLRLLHAGSAIAARGASRTKATHGVSCRVSAFQQCLERCATVAHVHTAWRARVHQTTCCPSPRLLLEHCPQMQDALCADATESHVQGLMCNDSEEVMGDVTHQHL